MQAQAGAPPTPICVTSPPLSLLHRSSRPFIFSSPSPSPHHSVEYIRAKDFRRYFVSRPQLLTEHLPATAAREGRPLEDQATDLLKLLVRRGLLERCARLKTKPAKGKEKLSAWPKQLRPHPEGGVETLAGEPAPEQFFYWTYERPLGVMTYVLGGLVAVLVVGVCLFPLAPYSVKIAIMYLCYALLALIFGTLLVRFLVFLTMWLGAGRHIWIFPNLLRDDLGIVETFAVLLSVDTDEKGKPIPRAPLKHRLATVAGIAVLSYVLWSYDTTRVAVGGMRSMHDQVLQYVEGFGKRTHEAIGDNSGTKVGTAAGAGAGAAGGSVFGQNRPKTGPGAYGP
jgi:hypothetical protein